MFCPKCKDEFRPGFTRCASCGVDLVDDLSQVGPNRGVSDAAACAVTTAGPMVNYCGFLDLEEARMARDRLRRKMIRSEILIREAADSTMDRPKEEYWLRIEQERFRACSEILGYDHVEELQDESFNCSNCGSLVAEHEAACPKCGARFEDD